MNPKLWARVAHLVDCKAVHQRPAYYELLKFAVEKEAEINFDKAKKTRGSTPKPKATMHFCMIIRNPHSCSQYGSSSPRRGTRPGEGEVTPVPSEESDSDESYEATPEDTTISQGDVEIAVRVAQALETFTG